MSALVAGLTACSALEAAVQVHVKYFWKQQEAERAFLDRVETELCQGAPAAPTFYATLHRLRAPVMDAINRHVRGAFFVKAACTSAGFEITPATHEMYVCNPPVLEHEPFNIGEGYYVVNLTNHLLRAGPAFCATPGGVAPTVARWRRELEVVMARHRGNTAFDELWDSFKPYCESFARAASPRVATARLQHVTIDCDESAGPHSLPQRAGVTCAEARAVAPSTAQVAQGIDAALQSPARCSCASGPPCVHEVIAMFGNDTLALLEAARQTVVAGYTASCPAGAGAGASGGARAARIAALAEATRERRERIALVPTAEKFYTAMTLAPIYHKLVPYCGVDVFQFGSGHGADGFACDGRHGSSGARANSPVMDLVPAADPARCGAATRVPCADAAAAVDALHALLGKITPVRTRLLARMFTEGHRDAQKAAPGKMFGTVAKRLAKGPPCDPELERLVDDVLALPPRLRDALRRLRAAADALDVGCVADTRRATVALAPGKTSTKLAAFAQAAATNRVFRSRGGLPLTLAMVDDSASSSTTASTIKMTATNNEPKPLNPLVVVGTVGVLFGFLLAFIHYKMKQTVELMFGDRTGDRYSDGDSCGSMERYNDEPPHSDAGDDGWSSSSD